MDVTKISQPDLTIWGIRIMEPVTSVTDLMVAAMCFYAFWMVHKQKKSSATITYIKVYFFTMGLATSLGGLIGHGFLYLFNDTWKLLGWYTSMISVALIERASISYANRLIPKALGKFFLILNIVELLILAGLVTATLHFRFVEFHTAYGFLVVVFSFHLYVFMKTRDEASRYMLYTVAVLLVAVFVFNYPVVLHTYFNHRDFAHILMIIASYLIMQSALRHDTETHS